MRFIHLAVITLCVMLTASTTLAKEKKSEKKADPQAMMETYKKLATPGEPHKQLASLAGSWTTQPKSGWNPEASHGISRHSRNEDVAGRTLSPAGIHRRDDGTTLLRDWDQRLRQPSQEICLDLDRHHGHRDLS